MNIVNIKLLDHKQKLLLSGVVLLLLSVLLLSLQLYHSQKEVRLADIKNQHLQKRVKQLEIQLDDLVHRIYQLEEQLVASRDSVQDLQREVKTLESHLHQERSKGAGLRKALADTRTELQDAISSGSVSGQQIAEMTQTIKSQERQLEQANQRIRDLEKRRRQRGRVLQMPQNETAQIEDSIQMTKILAHTQAQLLEVELFNEGTDVVRRNGKVKGDWDNVYFSIQLTHPSPDLLKTGMLFGIDLVDYTNPSGPVRLAVNEGKGTRLYLELDENGRLTGNFPQHDVNKAGGTLFVMELFFIPRSDNKGNAHLLPRGNVPIIVDGFRVPVSKKV